MTVINLKEAFKSRTKASEVRETSEVVQKAIKEGKIKKDQLSVRNIAEATLGTEVVQKWMNPAIEDEGALVQNFREAVDPTNLSAFTNITGLLVLQNSYEAYKSPDFIGSQLVAEESSREDNTRTPGIAPIDDKVLEVKEGQEYPTMRFGEDYIDVPSSKKRGAKIALTREMVFFDRTGQLGELSSALGGRLGVDKEVRILRTVLGVDNTFKRKGVARNTYVASADPRINQVSGIDLTDWTNLEALELAFTAMTDDRTDPEPIDVMGPRTLLVAPAKELTAMRITRATTVRTGTNSGNTQAYSDNPISSKVSNILTSPWITKVLIDGAVASDLAHAKYYHFYGQFKRAFRYRTLFPFQVIAAQHDKDSFERDVVAQFRCDERGVPYVYAPWFVIRAYNN